MASYFNITFNHVTALQAWMHETGAQALLDMKDFSLEVKHRGRYYRMYPMFQGRVDGRPVHLGSLAPGVDVRSFGGWRPYQTLTHPHSSDKALFKAWLRECGLRGPDSWGTSPEPPGMDYVLKARASSFGRGVFGPYRANTPATVNGQAPAGQHEMFGEQFIEGRMLKIWYWGARPFFAHVQSYPEVTGDGEQTALALLRGKVGASTANWGSIEEILPTATTCLAFQGLGLDDVVAPGRRVWIDYRFGQQYLAPSPTTPVSDNQLDELVAETGTQLAQMGQCLAQLLRATIALPVAITVDGMLDAQGNVWWLEMNTNSMLPPEAYAAMFADMFG